MSEKRLPISLVEPATQKIPFPRKLNQGELRRWYGYMTLATPATYVFNPNMQTIYSPPLDLGAKPGKVNRENISIARVQMSTTISPEGTVFNDGENMLTYRFTERAAERKASEYFGLELRAQHHQSLYFNTKQKELISRIRKSLVNYFATYRS